MQSTTAVRILASAEAETGTAGQPYNPAGRALDLMTMAFISQLVGVLCSFFSIGRDALILA
eukprot:2389017-Alexandrium_andersonii.AAC.1